tara:strand:- start:64 stop:2631 length:2568 start_codon:yes stop_codon:yes gene_type:complete
MPEDKDTIKQRKQDKKNFDSIVNKLGQGHEEQGDVLGKMAIQQWWIGRKQRKKAEKLEEKLEAKEKTYFDALADSITSHLQVTNVNLDSINNLVGMIADVIVEDAKPLWQYQKAHMDGFEEFIKQQQEEGKNLDEHQDWEKRRANEAERKSLLGGTAAGGDGGDGTGGGGLFGMGGGKGKGKGRWMAAGALATAALMRGATGIALMGFALSAFFGGLYLGDKTLAWLDADLKFDKIKEAAAGFSGILAELTPTAMTSLGALLLASTISGTGAAKGVGAMGFAISAFFVGLLAGDALIEGYTAIGGSVDFEGMKSVVKGFNSVIAEMSTPTMVILGSLIATGVGISVLATRSKAGIIRASMGIAAMGAGIAGLFIGLALGDKIIEGTSLKDSTDLTGIKKVIGSIGEIVGSLNEATIIGLGLLIGGGATLGVLSRSNPLGAGMGVAALGAGIAGLFIGLAVADKTMSWMNVDFTQTAAAMKGFSEAMDNLSWRAIATLGTLMGAGGVLAVVTTTATKVKFVAAMGAISGGIAAFFTGFAVLDLASKWIGEGGGQAKKLIVNFGEAIDALSGKTLTTLGVLMGSAVIGGMFLPATAAAVPAMGLIGAGIAAFFLAFDGLAALGDIIGVDGSSTKKLIINMAIGLSALNMIDGQNLGKVGSGLGKLTKGMALFFSAEGIGKIGAFLKAPINAWLWVKGRIFGEPAGDGKTKGGLIQNLVNALMPIEQLNDVNLDGFNVAIGNLRAFSDIEWSKEADDFAHFVDVMVRKMPDLGKVDMSNLTKIQQILGSNLAEGQTLQNAIAMTNAGHPMIHAPSTQFNTSNSGTTLLNTMNKDTTAVTIPGDLSINTIHNARGMNIN